MGVHCHSLLAGTCTAVHPQASHTALQAGGHIHEWHDCLSCQQQQGAEGLSKEQPPPGPACTPCSSPWKEWRGGGVLESRGKLLPHVSCVPYRYSQQCYQDHYHKLHSCRWSWLPFLLHTAAKLLRFLSRRELWLQRLCFCMREGREKDWDGVPVSFICKT